jgi:preprotein translocase subunit SecG
VMSSAFGSMGNQILGANRSTDVIEKITWYLAAGLIGLSIVSLFILPSPGDSAKDAATQQKSEIEEALKNGKGNTSLPSAPMPTSTMPVQSAATGQPEGSAQQSPAASETKK